MKENSFENILKKALVLETEQRQQFLNEVDDAEIRQRVSYLLKDDTELTNFILKTSAGTTALESLRIKELQAGDKIKQFIIKKLIAKGGMGAVYLAYDEKLKRNVAIKTIRSDYLLSQISQQRFEQEAQILSQINHPSICQIHDYLEYDDGHLLVLEYVKGHTLNQLKLSDEQKLDIFIQISSALEFAHKQGIVHRDLKPDNIMLTDEGVVKILDFGIAKSTHVTKSRAKDDILQIRNENNDLTQMGSLMGTLLYMSPEQAATKPVTSASDIYSYGVIMHKIITGQYAYNVEETESLRDQVINAELINFDKIPKKYMALITSMTDINASKRPDAKNILSQLYRIKTQPANSKKLKIGMAISVLALILVGILIWQFKQAQIQRLNTLFISTANIKINNAKEILNKAYVLPRHNILPDIEKANHIVDSLKKSINSNQTLDSYNKAKLLGLAFLVVEKYGQSIEYLKQAWEKKSHDPKLAFTIAQAMLNKYWKDYFSEGVYKQALYMSREDIIKQNKQLLIEAISYLEIAQVSDDFDSHSLEKIQAYELYNQNEFKKALKLLSYEKAINTGNFKELNFIGTLHWELYKKNYIKENYNQALSHLKLANETFDLAIQYGRSYIDSYHNLCNIKREMTENAVYDKQGNYSEIYTSSYDVCTQALTIIPGESFSFNMVAKLELRYAHLLFDRGKNIDKHMENAMKWNQQSIQHYPTPFAYKNKAIIHSMLADAKNAKGQNPTQEIDISLEALDIALEMVPQDRINIMENYFYIISTKFTYMLAHGQNLVPLMLKMEKLFEQTVKEEGFSIKENSYLISNYSDLEYYTALSEKQFKGNYQQWIKKYELRNKEIIDVPYNDFIGQSSLIISQLFLANTAYENGKDIANMISQIKIDMRKLSDLEDTFSWYLGLEARVVELQIKQAMKKMKPIEKYLIEMKEYTKKAIKMNPNDAENYLLLAHYYYLQANTSMGKKNRVESIHFALGAINKTIDYNPYQAEYYLFKAKLYQFIVENNLELKMDDISIDQLRQKALMLNPKIIPFEL